MGNSKKLETRLRVLEMVTEIASEASQNTNVVWMIEFQEELVERLYRKMIALVEEGASAKARDQAGQMEEEDEEEENENDENADALTSAAARL